VLAASFWANDPEADIAENKQFAPAYRSHLPSPCHSRMPFTLAILTWAEVGVGLLMRWPAYALDGGKPARNKPARNKPASSFGQSSSDAFAHPCREVVQWMIFPWDPWCSRIGMAHRTASS
jgi:hypothetical protein